jgi:hypothetical protein
MKRNVNSEAISKPGAIQEPHPELLDLAHCLGIDLEALKEWVFRIGLPTELLDSVISLAKRYRLNPLLGHLDWEPLPDTGNEVFITIDGWITLIHQEPSFAGITFTQSAETEDGVPLWMECTIYRKNLMHPITVREYYAELKTNRPIWERMPRRMLRHKTLQQCARLAFGIVGSEIHIIETKSCQKISHHFLNKTQDLISRKEVLKNMISNSL